MNKISIRFYNDIAVRAVWNDETNSWFFSVLDVVAAIRNERDYNKVRNYWKYLKSKLQKEDSQVVSATTQLKIVAPDGKKRLSDLQTAPYGKNLFLCDSSVTVRVLYCARKQKTDA